MLVALVEAVFTAADLAASTAVGSAAPDFTEAAASIPIVPDLVATSIIQIMAAASTVLLVARR